MYPLRQARAHFFLIHNLPHFSDAIYLFLYTHNTARLVTDLSGGMDWTDPANCSTAKGLKTISRSHTRGGLGGLDVWAGRDIKALKEVWRLHLLAPSLSILSQDPGPGPG